MASWRDLEQGTPHIARTGRALLEQARVALLGTLRRDGSPRISPVEPYFAGGQLMFGVMGWSGKARDLRRDLRCVLHSAISGPDAGEAELKLYGLAAPAGDPLREACPEAWWSSEPRACRRVRPGRDGSRTHRVGPGARADGQHALVARTPPLGAGTPLPLTRARP